MEFRVKGLGQLGAEVPGLRLDVSAVCSGGVVDLRQQKYGAIPGPA